MLNASVSGKAEFSVINIGNGGNLNTFTIIFLDVLINPKLKRKAVMKMWATGDKTVIGSEDLYHARMVIISILKYICVNHFSFQVSIRLQLKRKLCH